MDFGQCLHHETGMVMVDKVAHTVHGVKPGAVGVLILQNEVQISLRHPQVILVSKDLRGAGQQEGSVSGGIDNSSLTEWSIRATARRLRGFEFFNVVHRMTRDRLE